MTDTQKLAMKVLKEGTDFERESLWQMAQGNGIEINDSVEKRNRAEPPAEKESQFYQIQPCGVTGCRFNENGKCKSKVATSDNCNLENRYRYYEEKS